MSSVIKFFLLKLIIEGLGKFDRTLTTRNGESFTKQRKQRTAQYI